MTLSLPVALTGFLVAFYAVGGLFNGLRPAVVRREYARWGLPPWFPWVTAGVEFAIAGLLAFAPTRVAGAALGVAFLAAALAILVRHREYGHALAPAVGLALTAACGWLAA